LYLRSVLGLKPAPEFEKWLIKMNLFDDNMRPLDFSESKKMFLTSSSF